MRPRDEADPVLVAPEPDGLPQVDGIRDGIGAKPGVVRINHGTPDHRHESMDNRSAA